MKQKLQSSIKWASFLYFLPLLLLCVKNGNAQELFNIADNASNIPYHTLGVRYFSETYKEIDKWRNMSALRLMYGVTPRLSIYLTASVSNHHKNQFPEEYPYHNTPERGVNKPFKFNGFNVYAKYRVISIDGNHEHLRVAVYGVASNVKAMHDEGEPRLLDDNKGFGFGLITTYLKNKFAVSATVGGVFPGAVKGNQPDVIFSLPDIPTKAVYGKSLEYSLSFGYLILPMHYKNYNQLNVNLYAEFRGSCYGATKVYLAPSNVPEYYVLPNNYPHALKSGAYIDFAPGIQFIVNSNFRVDASFTLPLLGKSYSKLYPVYYIGLQRYFYL